MHNTGLPFKMMIIGIIQGPWICQCVHFWFCFEEISTILALYTAQFFNSDILSESIEYKLP